MKAAKGIEASDIPPDSLTKTSSIEPPIGSRAPAKPGRLDLMNSTSAHPVEKW